MLQASLVKDRGAFRLECSVTVDRGSTLVLVGESGSGKTTLLRLLAGLEMPDEGRIELDGTLLFDHPSHVWWPAFRRPVGYVSQDYALFPHLSVFANVAFGLRAQGDGRREVERRVGSALEQLGIGDLALRRPAELSGGQQQRAALARALVLSPRLLLLDEPLSALDLKSRRTVRVELHRLLAELSCTTIYVTHAPIEALAFGDRIAVIEEGAIQQTGTRAELLRHPRSAYVAEFMGVNLFRGSIVQRDAEQTAGVVSPEGWISIADSGDSGDVFAVVSPREITISLEAPRGSAQNSFYGPIAELVAEPPFGERLRVVLATQPPLVAEVTRQAAAALGLRPGLSVFASFKATGVTTYR